MSRVGNGSIHRSHVGHFVCSRQTEPSHPGLVNAAARETCIHQIRHPGTCILTSTLGPKLQQSRIGDEGNLVVVVELLIPGICEVSPLGCFRFVYILMMISEPLIRTSAACNFCYSSPWNAT